jgi:hypothetical protein
MNTEQIKQTIRTRFDHDAAKQQLREKYEAKLLFAHAGGMWRASPELLVSLKSFDQQDEVVLLDEYGTPVKVDRWDLAYQVEQRWHEQTNAWLVEHEELRRQR